MKLTFESGNWPHPFQFLSLETITPQQNSIIWLNYNGPGMYARLLDVNTQTPSTKNGHSVLAWWGLFSFHGVGAVWSNPQDHQKTHNGESVNVLRKSFYGQPADKFISMWAWNSVFCLTRVFKATSTLFVWFSCAWACHSNHNGIIGQQSRDLLSQNEDFSTSSYLCTDTRQNMCFNFAEVSLSVYHCMQWLHSNPCHI